jgi:undecaprenyl-diphosphatase
MSLDKEIFLNINSLAGKNHILDEFMILSAKTIPFIFAFILIYLWFTKRKNEALFAFYASIIGLLVNQIINKIYFRPRPFMVHVGKLLMYHDPEASFPSDHSTLAFSIGIVLIFFKSTRNLGVLSIILALLCGIARIYVGVHWPSDILGGYTIGLISAILILLLRENLKKVNKLLILIWDKIFYFP